MGITTSGLEVGTKDPGCVAYAGALGVPSPTILRIDQSLSIWLGRHTESSRFMHPRLSGFFTSEVVWPTHFD
ncbi:hypothetical protein [Rhodoferax sp.]|uniref:hypothetical protein n=1 Tax=Rhodoferax sp. TaxID=50421 RepID=UPI00374DE297